MHAKTIVKYLIIGRLNDQANALIIYMQNTLQSYLQCKDTIKEAAWYAAPFKINLFIGLMLQIYPVSVGHCLLLLNNNRGRAPIPRLPKLSQVLSVA